MRSQSIANRLKRHRFGPSSPSSSDGAGPRQRTISSWESSTSREQGGEAGRGGNLEQNCNALTSFEAEQDAAKNMLLFSQICSTRQKLEVDLSEKKFDVDAERRTPSTTSATDKEKNSRGDVVFKRPTRAQNASMTILPTPLRNDPKLVLDQRQIVQELISNFENPHVLPNDTFIKHISRLHTLYRCQGRRGGSFQREVECLSLGDPYKFAIDFSKRTKSDFSSLCVHGVLTRARFRRTHLYALASILQGSNEVLYTCFTLEEGVLSQVRKAGFQKSATLAVRLAVDAHVVGSAKASSSSSSSSSDIPAAKRIVYPQKNELFLNSYEPFLHMIFSQAKCKDVLNRLEAERHRAFRAAVKDDNNSSAIPPQHVFNRLEELLRSITTIGDKPPPVSTSLQGSCVPSTMTEEKPPPLSTSMQASILTESTTTAASQQQHCGEIIIID